MPITLLPDALFSFIHVDDAAAATMLALNQGEGGVYNIVDYDPALLREWLPVYAYLLGALQPMWLPKMDEQLTAGRFAVYFMNEQRGASNWKAKR